MIIIEAGSWIVPLQVMIGAVLPVLVGLVTTKVTHSGAKGVLLLALSFLTSLLTQALAAFTNGTPMDLVAALMFGFGTFILGVAMHLGLLKPAGVSDWVAGKVVKAEVVPGEVADDSEAEWAAVVNPEKQEN